MSEHEFVVASLGRNCEMRMYLEQQALQRNDLLAAAKHAEVAELASEIAFCVLLKEHV